MGAVASALHDIKRQFFCRVFDQLRLTSKLRFYTCVVLFLCCQHKDVLIKLTVANKMMIYEATGPLRAYSALVKHCRESLFSPRVVVMPVRGPPVFSRLCKVRMSQIMGRASSIAIQNISPGGIQPCKITREKKFFLSLWSKNLEGVLGSL